jgi:hypothetical protein
VNAGYEGYKYFSGKDPLADLQKELHRKLHPKRDTGSEPIEQFEKFADGGKIAKGVVGALTKAQEIAKARKAADMAPTARINLPAPNILVPSKLNNVRELVRQSKGNYGARRVERAADEIPNLEKMYKEDALKEAFLGENASGVMTMNPADFEKFAIELSKRTSVGPKAAELAKQGEIDKYTVPTDEYIKYLQQVGGFDYLPYLNLFKDEVGLPTKAKIVGHEGRHRSRALADKGETASLVQMIPRGDLREGMPRRTQEEFIEALKQELDSTNRLVLPEVDGSYRRPPVELPDIYAKGGLAMAEGGDPSKRLSGNILAGASWNSLNKTLGNELTTLTGQPTINTSVGGATTADTYKQLMDFINGGGSFDPNATVFLQTGGVDFITGVPREEVKSNIEQIISVLGDQGVNVVLTGAPYAASMDDVINNNFDPRIDPIFEEIAAAHPNVALVDSMGDILQDKSLLSDAIHTNETGTRRYNDDVIGALTALQQRESPVQGGREAETIIPQEVERITQPTIEQEFEQKMSDPVKQDFQEEIIQKEPPKPIEVAEDRYVEPEFQPHVERVSDTQPPPPVEQEAAVPSRPDYSRAYEALGGADVVNDLREKFLGYGLNEDAIEDVFSKYYPNEYQPEFAQEQYKRGGAVGQESPEDMARFHKRFAMHKAIGGSVKKMAGGGRASIFDAPVKRMSKGGSSDEPTAKEIAEALGELTVNQGREEYESFKKPRAATDIGNRGILAPALGAPVDLMNMGLMAADYIGSKATGKPIRLSSEKPFGGSEHLKDLMDKYGVTSGEDRPLTETMLSLFSPTGMIKGAQGMTKGAVKAAGAMRKPMSGLGAVREKTN